MNMDLENAKEDYEKKHGDLYNPCKNCPNYEVQDAESGTYAFCILGGAENCDWDEKR